MDSFENQPPREIKEVNLPDTSKDEDKLAPEIAELEETRVLMICFVASDAA